MIETLVRVLFFGALFASLGVYAWRTYRHVVHKETRHDREARRRAEAEQAGATTTTPRRPGPRPTAAGTPGAGSDDAPVKPVSFIKGAFAGPSLPDSQIEDGSLVREVIRQELAKKQGAAGQPGEETSRGPGSPGLPASSGDLPAEVGRTGMFAKPRRSVAELVSGIKLPCDLAPLVVDGDLDPNRALFATSGHTPATVASSVADELERLGFRIDSAGDNEAMARKPEGDLRIVIHDDLQAFPHAPRGGIVVELSS